MVLEKEYGQEMVGHSINHGLWVMSYEEERWGWGKSEGVEEIPYGSSRQTH